MSTEINLVFADLFPLINEDGSEGCGFLIGSNESIDEIWVVTNLTNAPDAFAISKEEANKIFKRAAILQKTVWGIIHTHYTPKSKKFGPSKLDLEVLKELNPGRLYAVFETTNNTLYFYNSFGTQLTIKVGELT